MKKAWAQVPALKARQWMTKLKTASFATIHFSVAFTVVYLLTGDAFVGGVMATLEPLFEYRDTTSMRRRSCENEKAKQHNHSFVCANMLNLEVYS